MIFAFAVLGLALVLFVIGLSTYSKAQQIKFQKEADQATLEMEEQLKQLQLESDIIQQEFNNEEALKKIQTTENHISELKEEVKHLLELKETQSQHLEDMEAAQGNYIKLLDEQYKKVETQLDDFLEEVAEQKGDAQASLEKIKSSLAAGVEAQLREREKAEKIKFYKITLPQEDIEDIEKLNDFKKSFNKPVIINKLIWTTYIQKKTTELCNRVLENKSVVCGIYKITNLNSGQCYVGQSVNIAERWKQHCKCGCDIDASATNKLYQDMIQTGIWNFSFELLEACPKEQLNEKESFWINLYSSDIYGLNSKKGNK